MRAADFLKQERERLGPTPPITDGWWIDGWMHPTYVIEVERIVNTIYPEVCYSTEQGFKGVGVIGVIGEIALYVNNGDIFEIGMGTSSLYLTNLARRHQRKVYHCDQDLSKLMLGVVSKQHVDPESEVFHMSSDDFFKYHTLPSLAFAFIDGGHEYEQAKRDFWNTFPYVVDDGYILLHDTYPPLGEDWLQNNQCWDCYRLRQELEKDKRFDCLSLPFKGQIGFTLIRKKATNVPYYQE